LIEYFESNRTFVVDSESTNETSVGGEFIIRLYYTTSTGEVFEHSFELSIVNGTLSVA